MIALSSALVGRRVARISPATNHTLREKSVQDHRHRRISLQTNVVMSAIHSWFGPRTFMRLARVR